MTDGAHGVPHNTSEVGRVRHLHCQVPRGGGELAAIFVPADIQGRRSWTNKIKIIINNRKLVTTTVLLLFQLSNSCTFN